MGKRITIPDNFVAIILTKDTAGNLKSLMLALRRPSRRLKDRLELVSAQAVAGEVLLAIIEGEDS